MLGAVKASLVGTNRNDVSRAASSLDRALRAARSVGIYVMAGGVNG